MPIDKQAKTNWCRAQQAYEHYQCFIAAKPSRYALSFADLAFVKNFKGGNAIIAEPVSTFSAKLTIYEKALQACADDSAFSLTLATIAPKDFPRIQKQIVDFVTLPEASASHIAGFGCSFASALLHFHFPLIVPILDKRALNGSGIQGLEVDSANNVKNLLDLYPELINYCRACIRKQPSLTLRTLDSQLFIQQLQTPPFH